jgi:hypothetical protein
MPPSEATVQYPPVAELASDELLADELVAGTVADAIGAIPMITRARLANAVAAAARRGGNHPERDRSL